MSSHNREFLALQFKLLTRKFSISKIYLIPIINILRIIKIGVCSGGQLESVKKRLRPHYEAILIGYQPSPLAMPALEGH